MKGSNTIILNKATMAVIVQHYFDTVMFREGAAPQVDDVSTDNSQYVFKVLTKENEK